MLQNKAQRKLLSLPAHVPLLLWIVLFYFPVTYSTVSFVTLALILFLYEKIDCHSQSYFRQNNQSPFFLAFFVFFCSAICFLNACLPSMVVAYTLPMTNLFFILLPVYLIWCGNALFKNTTVHRYVWVFMLFCFLEDTFFHGASSVLYPEKLLIDNLYTYTNYSLPILGGLFATMGLLLLSSSLIKKNLGDAWFSRISGFLMLLLAFAVLPLPYFLPLPTIMLLNFLRNVADQGSSKNQSCIFINFMSSTHALSDFLKTAKQDENAASYRATGAEGETIHIEPCLHKAIPAFRFTGLGCNTRNQLFGSILPGDPVTQETGFDNHDSFIIISKDLVEKAGGLTETSLAV